MTAVDAASIIRSRTASQPRSRLLSWISGEYSSDLPSKAESQAIAPPDLAVRREILRLELEAEVANLQAEADALLSEAAAEGLTIERPAGPPEAEPMVEGEIVGAPMAEPATAAPTAATDGERDPGKGQPTA